MSQWGSCKSRRVLAALLRIGWTIKRQRGTSHRILARDGWPDFVYAFHDGGEPRRRAARALIMEETFRYSGFGLPLTGSCCGEL
jgi:predicted RNA binding protein YcfA (HicA-like mRNA interferase family)